MSKWSDLYEAEILNTTIDDYITNKLKSKKKVVRTICKYVTNHKIMEFGSGTGILALYLSSFGNKVTAVDLDKDMIALSKKYFLDRFKNVNMKFICSDIRDINVKNKFDVCYSIGVLEHYTDVEIKDLINKQIEISNYVIFGIPTKYFDEDKKMYGNERYLSLSYWRKLVKDSGCEIIEETSYHYLNFFQRLIDFRKIFKPNPVHIFVIKKKILV